MIGQNIRFKAFRNVSKQLSLSLRIATPDWFQKSLRKRLYDLYNALSMPGSRLSHRCMSILDIWCSVYVPYFRLPTSRSTGSWLAHHMYWSEWPIYFYSVGTLLNIPYVTQRFLYYMSIHISTSYSLSTYRPNAWTSSLHSVYLGSKALDSDIEFCGINNDPTRSTSIQGTAAATLKFPCSAGCCSPG